jgi:para-aminobenzoate synthetase component 1
LPFIGGALGLFGYDLGRRFERLPAVAQQDIQVPDMAVGIYDWALLRNVATGHWQLAHWGDEAGLARRLDWLMAQRERTPSPSPDRPLAEQHDAGRIRRQVCPYPGLSGGGDCYQINLTQRFSAPYQGDEWSAYLALSAANKAPFSAFVRLPHSAILSLSPERFLLLDKRHIETKPIKGTRPRHPDPAQDARVAGRSPAPTRTDRRT